MQIGTQSTKITRFGARVRTAVVGLVFAAACTGAQAGDANFRILHWFATTTGDGAYNGVTVDPATQALYGVTFSGGLFTSNGEPSIGNGVLFRLDADGTYTVLHAFEGGDDGFQPYAAVVIDSKSTVFGTASQGGTGSRGTLWAWDAASGFSTLANFSDELGAIFPELGLALGPDKLLHGAGGGCSPLWTANPYAKTVVIRPQANGVECGGGLITLDGNRLYTGNDVQFERGEPYTELLTGKGVKTVATTLGTDYRNGMVKAPDGSWWGTTRGGGHGYGVLWRIDTQGVYTVVHNFTNNGGDGASPTGKMALGADGRLYGSTSQGGNPYSRYGTVFAVDPITGAYEVVFQFDDSNGRFPEGSLVADAAGNLYGTTQSTIFEITPATP